MQPVKKLIPRQVRRARHIRRAMLFVPGHEDRYCVVLDISKGGAKIVVGGDDAIPDRFELAFSAAGARRDCELIWRRGKTAGLKFI